MRISVGRPSMSFSRDFSWKNHYDIVKKALSINFFPGSILDSPKSMWIIASIIKECLKDWTNFFPWTDAKLLSLLWIWNQFDTDTIKKVRHHGICLNDQILFQWKNPNYTLVASFSILISFVRQKYKNATRGEIFHLTFCVLSENS